MQGRRPSRPYPSSCGVGACARQRDWGRAAQYPPPWPDPGLCSLQACPSAEHGGGQDTAKRMEKCTDLHLQHPGIDLAFLPVVRPELRRVCHPNRRDAAGRGTKVHLYTQQMGRVPQRCQNYWPKNYDSGAGWCGG